MLYSYFKAVLVTWLKCGCLNFILLCSEKFKIQLILIRIYLTISLLLI